MKGKICMILGRLDALFEKNGSFISIKSRLRNLSGQPKL